MSKVLWIQTVCSRKPRLAKVKALFPETCQPCLQPGFVIRESTQPGPAPALPAHRWGGPPFCTSLGAKQGAGAQNSERWWWWITCKIQLRSAVFARQRISMESGYETCLWPAGLYPFRQRPQTEPCLGRTIKLLHLCPRRGWVAFMC